MHIKISNSIFQCCICSMLVCIECIINKSFDKQKHIEDERGINKCNRDV